MAGKTKKASARKAAKPTPAPMPVAPIPANVGGVNYGDRKRHRTR